jgi:hypothetical protein
MGSIEKITLVWHWLERLILLTVYICLSASYLKMLKISVFRYLERDFIDYWIAESYLFVILSFRLLCQHWPELALVFCTNYYRTNIGKRKHEHLCSKILKFYFSKFLIPLTYVIIEPIEKSPVPEA